MLLLEMNSCCARLAGVGVISKSSPSVHKEAICRSMLSFPTSHRPAQHAWLSIQNAADHAVTENTALPWPGFEPGLSRPQREVLTTIRSRPMHQRIPLQIAVSKLHNPHKNIAYFNHVRCSTSFLTKCETKYNHVNPHLMSISSL